VLLEAVESDWKIANVDSRRRAMLTYAAKLTQTPSGMSRTDVDALRAVGFEDADILAITEVTSYYAYANRIADGLGVAIES